MPAGAATPMRGIPPPRIRTRRIISPPRGPEALIGFLYLTGQEARALELFRRSQGGGPCLRQSCTSRCCGTPYPPRKWWRWVRGCAIPAQRSGDLEQKIAAKDQQAFVERLLNMGHESVLEHASFTFGVEGVSRVLLAQLTRHRLASFSVQSQRYVSYEKGFGYIVPPKIAALGPEAEAEFKAQMVQMHAWYTGWQEKLGTGEGGNEDARFVLPGACETRLMVTMNTRELAALLQPAHV